MDKLSSLNDLYSQYSNGLLEKKRFEQLIYKYLIDNYRDIYVFQNNKDICIDILCAFYPRMSGAIDSYQNTGSSFETYILNKIHWLVREIRARETSHSITEQAFWETRYKDMSACENEVEYLNVKPAFKPVSNPRQILILMLKSYFFLSQEFICRAAPAVGIEQKHLEQLIEKIRALRHKRDEQVRDFQSRLHAQYYRCHALESRMAAAEEGTVLYETMKGRAARAKKRYERMKRRYKGLNFNATNKQIAEVLGIAKGTVDSALYQVKQKTSMCS